jgi:hypothetical protein
MRHQYIMLFYVLDYNGEDYITVPCSCPVNYTSQIEITSLPIFPLRFHPDREKLIHTAQVSGNKFREAVASKHMLYCGWNARPLPEPIVSRPRMIGGGQPPPPAHFGPGGPLRPPEGHFQEPNDYLNPGTEPDNTKDTAIHKVIYIESEVIIDVKEACRAVPKWHPGYIPWVTSTWQLQDWSVVEDLVEIIRWTDLHRKQRISSVQDRTQADDNIAGLASDEFHKEDKFSTPQRNPDFTPEDLTLLPERLYAYALRERKFFSGDIDSFHRLATGDNPFEDLKIDENHIRIVQSVVWSHFQRKSMESSGFQSRMNQDLIRGKGRGLVILLHGAPGVGKTATAEAVALWHRKPLFVITCGDLGFTPQGVESSLSEIFRLAHLWDW